MTALQAYETVLNQLEAARKVLKEYDQAADKFIKKVDTGRARSVETYNDLKLARELSSRL